MTKQPNPLDAAREKVSPPEYAELLKCLDLQNIFLKDLKPDIASHDLSGRNAYSLSEAASVVEHRDESVTIDVTYRISATSNRKRLVSVNAKYRVVFSTTRRLPEEFFTLYNEYSLPLQTFPYLRECVNSLFSRMGLPPLLLPLRKHLVGESR